MNIEWIPPEPRTGLLGQWDRFIGPGATKAENLLIWIPAFLFSIGLIIHATVNELGWNGWQYLVAFLIAIDITGGVIANATNTTKRWYHREGQTRKKLILFTANHFWHLLFVAGLFRSNDWLYFVVTYAYLMLGAFLILQVPLYLERPFAMFIYMGGLLIGLYVFSPTPGFEWFLPFFYAKLLICHLVKEAPFAADSGG